MKKYYQKRNTKENKKKVSFEYLKHVLDLLIHQFQKHNIQYSISGDMTNLFKILEFQQILNSEIFTGTMVVDEYEIYKNQITSYMELQNINASYEVIMYPSKIKTEGLFFTVVEFIHDNIYDYNTTTKKLDSKSVRQTFRNHINNFLCDYKNGYELNENGEIIVLFNSELKELVEKELPESTNKTDIEKIESAIKQFKNRNSTIEDKRGAISQLSAVLEPLIKTLEENCLSKDEKELFNIANNFGIRHNKDQKIDYDIDFLDWMFQSYLATIHLALRLKERKVNVSEVNN